MLYPTELRALELSHFNINQQEWESFSKFWARGALRRVAASPVYELLPFAVSQDQQDNPI